MRSSGSGSGDLHLAGIGLDDLARLVVERCGPVRPAVVPVNGHSSSGKTTLAGQLTTRLPAAAVLHTDDLAWHQGVLAWDVLLCNDVLPVVRTGAALDYRPPACRPGPVPARSARPGLCASP
jgi:hypothetical protein